jgi:RNA polymerase sigma-70 factor (ECF subfamily)
MTNGGSAEYVAGLIVSRRSDYYRIALSLCGNRDDAMDAVSDMTLIAIEQYHALRDPTAFVAWTSTILVNCCRKRLRGRKRTVSLDDLDNEPVGTDGMDELSADLRRALAILKPIYREAVVLKELFDYSYKEIAAMLRIPVGTAQSRHFTGLRAMRKSLGGSYDEQI